LKKGTQNQFFSQLHKKKENQISLGKLQLGAQKTLRKLIKYKHICNLVYALKKIIIFHFNMSQKMAEPKMFKEFNVYKKKFQFEIS
jgi:hypothetical protein